MKNMKKRILALILSVCMILTMMPSMVFAAEPDATEDESKAAVTETAPVDEAAPAAEMEEEDPAAQIQAISTESGLSAAQEPQETDWSDVVIANMADTADKKVESPADDAYIQSYGGKVNDEVDSSFANKAYDVSIVALNLRLHKGVDTGAEDAFWIGIGVPYVQGDYYLIWTPTDEDGDKEFSDIKLTEAQAAIKEGNNGAEEGDGFTADENQGTAKANNKYVMKYVNAANYDKFAVIVLGANKKAEALYCVDLGGVICAEPTEITAGFEADQQTARKATNTTDADANTMWVRFDEANGYHYGVVEVDGAGESEANDYIEAKLAGRSKMIYWTYGRKDHVGDANLEAGEYTFTYHPLKETLFGTKENKWVKEQKEDGTYVEAGDAVDFFKSIDGNESEHYLSDSEGVLTTSINLSKVSFSAGKGAFSSGNTAPDPVFAMADGEHTVKLPNVKPTRSNYIFAGWTDGTTTVGADAEEYTVPYSSGEEITLKAVWEKIMVTEAAPTGGENDTFAKVGVDEAVETNGAWTGTIKLSGIIAKPSAETTVTLNLTLNDKTQDKETTIKLKMDEDGKLIFDGADTINLSGITYTIDISDVTVLPENVELAPGGADLGEVKEDLEKGIDNALVTALGNAATTAASEDMKAAVKEEAVAKELAEVVKGLEGDANKEGSAAKLLKDAQDAHPGENLEKIEVVTYLEITPVEFLGEADAKHLTVDITPMYKIVAVNADKGNPEIVVEGKALEAKVTTPIKITINVPSDFITENKAYVVHETNGKIIEATVSGTQITFPSDGFSEYTIYATDPKVATIGGDNYTSLQAAVDAAIAAGMDEVEITVTDKAETAKVNGEIAITLKFEGELDDDGLKKLLSAGSGYELKYDPYSDTEGGIIFEFGPIRTGGGGSTGGSTTPATVTTPTSANGSYTVSNTNAKAGDTVTVTPKANEGYEVDKVVVTDKNGKELEVKDNGDGTFSFVMPAEDAQPVTVNVTFKESTVTPSGDDTIKFKNEKQLDALQNRTTTSKDCTLKLEAIDGADIGDLSDWTITSDNPKVVKVLKNNKLRYKDLGTANITVVAKDKDGKEYTITFPVNVTKLGTPTFTLSHISSNKARTFTVTTSTVRGADGFQVKYSLKKSLKSNKHPRFECGKKLNRKTITAYKSGRTYYVRVRAYKVVDGERVTSDWSKLTKQIVSK